ncbi:helix-turn-helix domain-containing protein [Streptomyces sp. NBC_00691]|uniref:helix-turn-helix domain-containing protein n=1 Tax=Streptomyces sp. NBC_00691 TaxID=2903671 RepID=UPI002E300441|nr:helix-turn-helix domain-containing protein [Streptomyces sp. NBC_00691]
MFGEGDRVLLSARMRRMKDEAGLSYGRLAERTHYSRSSWERMLNGKQLPSAVAVEEFAAAVGGDAAELLPLLAAAAEGEEPRSTPVQAGGPVPEPVCDPAPGPERAASVRARGRHAFARGRNAARTAGLVAAGALLGSLSTVVLQGSAGGANGTAGGAAPSPSPTPIATAAASGAGKPPAPGCLADECLRREPQAMDCQWDATTVRETWLRGLKIQLRYSEVCSSVWGRIENGTVGDSVVIKDRHGRTEQATIRVDNDTYTRMLAVSAGDPPASVVICGQIPRFHESECSPLGALKP